MAVPNSLDTITREKFMSSTNYLYWIHYPSHTDPRSEGYIGITKDPYHREWRHRNNAGNPIAYNAMRKGAVFSVLEQYNTREEAISREIELRPSENIGWNIREGGGDPPPMTKELGACPEFRKAVSEGRKKEWTKRKAEGFAHKKITCKHCDKDIGSTMHAKHEKTCLFNPDVYNRLPECENRDCSNKVTKRPDRTRFCSHGCARKTRYEKRIT